MCRLLERQNPVIAERPQPQDHCRPGGIQIREFGSCKIPEVGKQGRQPEFCAVFWKETTFSEEINCMLLKD